MWSEYDYCSRSRETDCQFLTFVGSATALTQSGQSAEGLWLQQLDQRAAGTVATDWSQGRKIHTEDEKEPGGAQIWSPKAFSRFSRSIERGSKASWFRRFEALGIC